MREHTKVNDTSSTPEQTEEQIKWYLDPRIWLIMFGLICWVVSAQMTTVSHVKLLP